MKKFAWMIAILGLCASSMVACGGDDEKKANGEACEAATDCISNYCNEDKICADAPANDTDKKANGEACEAATDCKSNYCSEDKICADDPALEIPECEDNGDCENHTEGKLVCNVDAGVCVECLADNKEDDACDGSKPGPICVENVCSKCTDNAQCGENQECDLDSGKCVAADGTCLEDKDCKDPATPHCVNSTCVAEIPTDVDPCADVTCEAGTCNLGICVTDDMKALKAEDPCNENEFQSFCNENAAVMCAQGKIAIDKCADDNLGTCTAVDNRGKKSAYCSGNEDMLARCAVDPEAATINVCYGSQKWIAEVICTTDVLNKAVAIPNGLVEDCEKTDCEYAEAGPVCKAAE